MIPIVPKINNETNISKATTYSVDDVERILVNTLLNIQVMFEQLHIPANITVNYAISRNAVEYEISYKDKICEANIVLK